MSIPSTTVWNARSSHAPNYPMKLWGSFRGPGVQRFERSKRHREAKKRKINGRYTTLHPQRGQKLKTLRSQIKELKSIPYHVSFSRACHTSGFHRTNFVERSVVCVFFVIDAKREPYPSHRVAFVICSAHNANALA